MKEAVRFVVLLALFVHHLVAWGTMTNLGNTKVSKETIDRLRVFIDLGWRFLTNWNFFNQTIYILAAILLHIAPKFMREKTIFKAKKINWFFYWSIVYPWSVYVPLLFWGLYSYDRELIFPKIIDAIFPWWLNQMVHTDILILIILEPMLNDQRPPRFKLTFRTFTCHAAVYVFLLNFTYFYNNVWLYEYLKILNWPMRVCYYLGTYGLCLGLMGGALKVQNHYYEKRIKAKLT